jgi:hypothetical protein
MDFSVVNKKESGGNRQWGPFMWVMQFEEKAQANEVGALCNTTKNMGASWNYILIYSSR